MHRKLKFMLPNVGVAREVWKAMLLACIENKNIYFLAKPGINLGKLQPASVAQSTGTIHEGERGVLIGAGLGLLAGVLALIFPPWYVDAHWTVILAITTAFGAITGALGMALLGVSLTNSDHAAIEHRIAQGEILMILSVPFHRVKEIRRMVNRLHLRNDNSIKTDDVSAMPKPSV